MCGSSLHGNIEMFTYQICPCNVLLMSTLQGTLSVSKGLSCYLSNDSVVHRQLTCSVCLQCILHTVFLLWSITQVDNTCNKVLCKY